MNQRADELLNQGVAKKRQGDLEGAQQLYLEAIALDPSNLMGYYSLAKTCYLAGKRAASVINYLRALHLSLFNQLQNDLRGRPNALFGQLDPAFESFLRAKHDAAVFLPFQQNMTTHLGHALIDLDAQIFQQAHKLLFQDSASEDTLTFMRNHVDQYRMSLSGTMVQLNEELESNAYSQVALFFAVRVIVWNHMGDTSDVRTLYPDSMIIPVVFG
jgi:tetratricopeptide (TPR) repeat protein